MNKILLGIAMGGPIFLGTQAFADGGRSGISRHQMIAQVVDCVKKRTAARTVSYRDAIKACKAEVKGQTGASSDTLLASGTH